MSPQQTDYHAWTIPTTYDVSEEDEDVWGAILNTLFDGDIDEAVIKKDPLVDRPAAGTAGRWFMATDQSPPSIYLDDGTQWVTIWDGDATTLGGLGPTDYLQADGSVNLTGDLSVQGNTLRGWEGNLSFAASGWVDITGWDDTDGGVLMVRDGPNNLDLIRAHYGGQVDVPSGPLYNQGNRVLTTADGAGSAADTIYMVADMGADDTGATAVDTAFSDAITAASPGDTIRFEGGGTFLLNNKHQIQKGITLDLRGAELQLAGVAGDWQIQFIPTGTRGGALTSQTGLSTTVSPGDLTIPVEDTTGYAKGDTILLQDNAAIDLTPGLDAGEQHITFATVESVDGTNSIIEVSEAPHHQLRNAGAGVLQVANAAMLDEPAVIGGTITGGGVYAFQFAFCNRPRFKDVTVEDQLSYVFMFSECIDGLAEGCTVRHPQTFGSGEAEMFYVRRSAHTTIRECSVEKCRRGVDILAGAYDTHVTDCEIYNFSHNGISVHQSNPAGKIHVTGCEVRGASESHNVVGNGVSGSPNLTELVVEGCTIQAPGRGVTCNQPTLIDNCRFLPGAFQTASTRAIDIQSGDVRVENTIIDSTDAATEFQGMPVNVDPRGNGVIEDIYLDVDITMTDAATTTNKRGIYVKGWDTAGDGVVNLRIRGTVTDTATTNRCIGIEAGSGRMDHIDVSADCHSGDHAVYVDMTNGDGMETARFHDMSVVAARHTISTFGDGVNSYETIWFDNIHHVPEGGETQASDMGEPGDHFFASNNYFDMTNVSSAFEAVGATNTHYSNNSPVL